jgi:hypothetical protein
MGVKIGLLWILWIFREQGAGMGDIWSYVTGQLIKLCAEGLATICALQQADNNDVLN